MLSLSLVDPLPQQAITLYQVRQSKITLIQTTAIEIDNLCSIIDYLKHIDEKEELLTDTLQREKLYQSKITKLKKQQGIVKDDNNLKDIEIKRIYCKSNRHSRICLNIFHY